MRLPAVRPHRALATGLLLGLTAGALPPAAAEPIEGIVRPSKEVVLNAPLASILKSLAVSEGVTVARDQPLAYMDDGQQQIAVRSAELQAQSTAAIENAQLVLQEAEIQVERVTAAQASDAASEWEVRRTALQADQARAQLKQAQEQQVLAATQLELERERLRSFTVLAPFDGRVIVIEAEAGASLTQQDALMSLVALHPLKAEFHVPAAHYGGLTPGGTHTLSLRRGGEDHPVEARLTLVDPVIDPASQTFRVVLEIDNHDEALPSGLPVHLSLPDLEEDSKGPTQTRRN